MNPGWPTFSQFGYEKVGLVFASRFRPKRSDLQPSKVLGHVNLTPLPSFYYVAIAWVTQEAAVCATHRNTNNTRSNG